MESRTYQVGRSTITLVFGSITASKAEALVSSDDCYLSMGGGVSQAIARAAGPGYRDEAQRLARTSLWELSTAGTDRALASPGEVIVTPAGGLRAKYVLHVVTRAPKGPRDVEVPHDLLVRQGCRRVMELLPLLRCRSVAFPSLGTGFAGIDPQVTAEQMAGVLVRVLLEAEEEYCVEVYLLDRRLNAGAAGSFYESFEKHLDATLALAVLESGGERRLEPPPEPLTGGADREAVRRFDIYTMLLRLDERRAELGALLQGTLDLPPEEAGDSLQRITEQLEAVARLRRIYEGELVLSAPRSACEPRSVFLSSTWEDLREHRQRARAAVERLGLRFIGMEEFLPTGAAPVDFIRREVNRAETYVGILGMRYGSVDPALGFSMTELEYRQAVASRKPRCLFVMSDRAHTPIGLLERDVERFRKLLEFRERVLKENTVLFFDDAEDLERKVERSLGKVVSGP